MCFGRASVLVQKAICRCRTQEYIGCHRDTSTHPSHSCSSKYMLWKTSLFISGLFLHFKTSRGEAGGEQAHSAQVITWHGLSEPNFSSISTTQGTRSWGAHKSKEVAEFKKGSSNINASVKLVREDLNCQEETMQTSSFSAPRQGVHTQSGRVQFSQTPPRRSGLVQKNQRRTRKAFA